MQTERTVSGLSIQSTHRGVGVVMLPSVVMVGSSLPLVGTPGKADSIEASSIIQLRYTMVPVGDVDLVVMIGATGLHEYCLLTQMV